ncbi:MAG TPA: hypothetical protein VKP04_06035 [Ktedonobacteraceae bacterium]|nr:hypothetical protein [Ktedonobacteraceae bacterium]
MVDAVGAALASAITIMRIITIFSPTAANIIPIHSINSPAR